MSFGGHAYDMIASIKSNRDWGKKERAKNVYKTPHIVPGEGKNMSESELNLLRQKLREKQKKEQLTTIVLVVACMTVSIIVTIFLLF